MGEATTGDEEAVEFDPAIDPIIDPGIDPGDDPVADPEADPGLDPEVEEEGFWLRLIKIFVCSTNSLLHIIKWSCHTLRSILTGVLNITNLMCVLFQLIYFAFIQYTQ